MQQLLRFSEVTQKTGMSRRTLYRAMQAGEFPQAVKLRKHGRAVGWHAEAVDEWIASRPERR